MKMGPGGSKLYVIGGGKLAAYAFEKGTPSPIPFSATLPIEARTEEQALFREIWWGLDRLYYDPNMHGKAWSKIRDKFALILPYVSDRSDFYDLMGEMMEELDSSHLGATAPSGDPGGSDSTAYLGVEFDPVVLAHRGAYVVSRVMPGSPAAQPASLLKVGDELRSIDGKGMGGDPIASMLNKKSGKKVTLAIMRSGRSLSLAIKPLPALAQRGLEYEAWVDYQRAETDRLSGGKLAYFHIASMDDPSFELFLRQIRTLAPGKQGAIIDVRYNGGGFTSHKLLGVLIKTPWLIRTTRGPDGLKLSENIYRGDSLELPTALLMNTASFSNAEIMGEGFRQLKRGPLVGERTPGYVIGTGSMSLWDGGAIRMPVIGAYAVNGENLERNGRKPDFNVWFDPNAWIQGRDLQLEKAVEELMKSLGH